MTKEERILLVTELRRQLHKYPESSMKEVKTKRILMQFLTKYTNNLEIVDKGSWFYARIKGKQGDNPIAFRADYDAVTCSDGCPRHLCGHDGHSAILAGFSLWLDEQVPERDVYLIFQPGEEIGAGAAICSALIEEKNIGEIYGIHNIPGYKCGDVILLNHTFACASTGLEIELVGKQSHAAYPENGINPSGAILKIVQGVEEFTGRKHKGIVLGTVIGIEVGSRSYGVSAGEGVLRLTIRAEYQDEYDTFISYIEQMAKQSAALIGATCRITRIEEFPATMNDKTCIRKIHTAANLLNLNQVYPVEPFRWSEDFGYYLQKTKGAMMGIGCGVDHPGLHTMDYEFNDELIAPVIELYKKLLE